MTEHIHKHLMIPLKDSDEVTSHEPEQDSTENLGSIQLASDSLSDQSTTVTSFAPETINVGEIFENKSDRSLSPQAPSVEIPVKCSPTVSLGDHIQTDMEDSAAQSTIEVTNRTTVPKKEQIPENDQEEIVDASFTDETPENTIIEDDSNTTLEQANCDESPLKWVGVSKATYEGSVAPLPGYGKERDCLRDASCKDAVPSLPGSQEGDCLKKSSIQTSEAPQRHCEKENDGLSDSSASIAADSLIGYLELRRVKHVIPLVTSETEKKARQITKSVALPSKPNTATPDILPNMMTFLSYEHGEPVLVTFHGNKQKIVATDKGVKSVKENCSAKLSEMVKMPEAKYSSSRNKVSIAEATLKKPSISEDDNNKVLSKKAQPNSRQNSERTTRSMAVSKSEENILPQAGEKVEQPSLPKDANPAGKMLKEATEPKATERQHGQGTKQLKRTAEKHKIDLNTDSSSPSESNLDAKEIQRDQEKKQLKRTDEKSKVHLKKASTSSSSETNLNATEIQRDQEENQLKRTAEKTKVYPKASSSSETNLRRSSRPNSRVRVQDTSQIEATIDEAANVDDSLAKSDHQDAGASAKLHKKPKRDILLRYQSEITRDNVSQSPIPTEEIRCNKLIEFVTQTYQIGFSYPRVNTVVSIANKETVRETGAGKSKVVKKISMQKQQVEKGKDAEATTEVAIVRELKSVKTIESTIGSPTTKDGENTRQMREAVKVATSVRDSPATGNSTTVQEVETTQEVEATEDIRSSGSVKNGQPCKVVLKRCDVTDQNGSLSPKIAALKLKSSLLGWKKMHFRNEISENENSARVGDSRKRKLSPPKAKDRLGLSTLKKAAISTEKIYKCELCDYSTTETAELLNHSTKSHAEEEMMYTCDVCEYITSRQSKLLSHVKAHTGLPLTNGQKEGKTGTALKNVFENKISSTSLSSENSCGDEAFSNSQASVSNLEVSAATQNEHSTEEENYPFACKLCSFRGQRLYNLQIHERSHKSSLKIYKCKHCSYATSRWARYIEHQYTHKNISELSCYYDDCAFTTSDSKVLKSHRLLHKVVPQHICERCNYTTFRKDFLDKHRLRHHSQDSTSSSKMRYHTSPVQRDLPFKCVICWYAARDSKTLAKHMKIHAKTQDVGRFCCNMCKFTTNFEFSLKRHIQHSKSCNRRGQN